jgi:hypothetical protein
MNVIIKMKWKKYETRIFMKVLKANKTTKFELIYNLEKKENCSLFPVSIYKRVKTAGWPDVNSKQFKCTLLDGSSGFHISKSTVSVSYTFH